MLTDSRRDFLKTSAALATGVIVAGAGTLIEAPSAWATRLRRAGRGKVTGVEHPAAMMALNKENAATIVRMTNEAMKRFTGKKSVAQAWKEFVHPTDIVGIKLNCLAAPKMESSPAMVGAMVKGLNAAGVPNERIYLYEQYEGRLTARGGGYKLNSDPAKGPLVVHLGGKSILTDKGLLGYETKAAKHASGPSHYANLLNHCTALINAPVIKDHELSGVTVGMKNMTHGNINNPHDYHEHDCNPQIADIYAHPKIKDKVRLIVCDGTRIQYDGGPQDNNRAKLLHNRIYVATDPVAMDALGFDLVEKIRKDKGLDSLHKRHPTGSYLVRAGALGLGEHRIDKITLDLTTLG